MLFKKKVCPKTSRVFSASHSFPQFSYVLGRVQNIIRVVEKSILHLFLFH
ncbi:hypothetical protein LEP1GSC060_3951 [Leptospira weilii serovar Ranarum str. ICFT]|uniref:Uncharacterized protein n=1 Tax=Leptospira weilii serovar Ranarum str. ICFT TaxID=1218598 RepID=N1WHU0_9LEPT|nr:hypothetical protein LEP1GSC060_3951 [Leptospira weilii serovar Ranarum str. ICFT]